MKSIISAIVMLVGSSYSYAGIGGSVSCQTPDRQIVAHYHYFLSSADNWSTAQIMVKGQISRRSHFYNETNFEALSPVTIRTSDGLTIKVSPDLKQVRCVIEVSP